VAGRATGALHIVAAPGTLGFAREAAARFEDANPDARVSVAETPGDRPASPRRVWVASNAIVFATDPDLAPLCLTGAQLNRGAEPATRSLADLGRDAETGKPLPDADPADIHGMQYSAFLEDDRGLELISVDAGEACVRPGLETIGDGSYPLSRSLYLYLPAATRAGSVAASFRDFLAENDEAIAESVNLVPAPAGARR
jgi:hypothetical protein